MPEVPGDDPVLSGYVAAVKADAETLRPRTMGIPSPSQANTAARSNGFRWTSNP